MRNWLYSSLILVFIVGCSQPAENNTEPAAEENAIETQTETPAVSSGEETPSTALEPKAEPGEKKDEGEEAPYHESPEQDEIDKIKAEKQKNKK